MVTNNRVKSSSHCSSGDIIFLVAEEEDSSCSGFDLPLILLSKEHGLKAYGKSYQ